MKGMRIEEVEAFWLRCPIPPEKQHVSEFGLPQHFDAAASPSPRNPARAGTARQSGGGERRELRLLVACVRHELRPLLLGEDASRISRASPGRVIRARSS
jgi:D-galactarolactone cycloisomerase